MTLIAPTLHRTGLRFVAMRACAFATGLVLVSGSAGAQAFGPGPAGTPVGSSMAGARIVGAPKSAGRLAIPDAKVFGDTAEERAYGKDYDDSYITPPVGSSKTSGIGEERATEGRANLNGINAGTLARQGARAIGRSAVTRGNLRSRGGRAVIVLPER